MSKKVFLTGCTSLIGVDILNALINTGYEIFAVSRKKHHKKSTNIKWINFDISKNAEQLFNILPDIDCVVHAAALVRSDNEDDEFISYRKTNIEFSENLFRWCKNQNKSIPVIFISSFNILRKPLELIITENHLVAPLNIYAISKYWGELALFNYSKLSQYRPVVLRISSPVSFNFDLLHNTVLRKWIIKAKNKQNIIVYGTGNKTQDFVSTTDIAQAVLLAIENQSVNGIYNISSGTQISMNDLAKLISENFNTEIIHSGVDINENDRWNISIEKAKKELNFFSKYTSIEVIKNLLNKLHENSNT